MTEVLAVASEAFPLVKTGGLADVVGALPAALGRHGVAVRTLLPGYPSVLAVAKGGAVVASFDDLFGGPAAVVSANVHGLDMLAIDAPHLYAREGDPYVGPDGKDWHDNAFRFAGLAKVAAEIGRGATALTAPDVVHVHDWQAGLAPAYLAYGEGAQPKTVATIHNIAFQGWFPPALLGPLGLPERAMALDGVEYFGGIGFLKAALNFADRITTVSPTYAAEILEAEGGLGLDGLLLSRADVVSGVLNGIDVDVWNPETDAFLPEPFSAADRKGRHASRLELAETFGLDIRRNRLVFGVVSRLSSQKGLDLLADAMPALLRLGASLALVGAGESWLEDRFCALAAAHPGRIGVFVGYDERRAHLVQAGCDAILVPSRFEPCGLTQLCALRYGAVPVVARVGGLADTVIDANPMALAAGCATGVQFSGGQSGLEAGLRRAAALHADRRAWTRLQLNGMRTDVSWDASAKAYAALYAGLAAD